MSNHYLTLYRTPRLHRKLPKAQETLARRIVASGCLRLDADNTSNFVRLQSPAERLNLTFSHRELHDSSLLPHTRTRLRAALRTNPSGDSSDTRVDIWLEKARQDLTRKTLPDATTELMVVRALVTCNALPVMQLIHQEKAELYVSFGRTVSDVLDIATWQEVGDNNGLQAVGKQQNAIYVSCGGHPFVSDAERTYSSDGFPALARMLVVAAQETGHNADMRRSPQGALIGRHSAEGWGHAPSAKAGKARKHDVLRTAQALRLAERWGLHRLTEWERHRQFYRQNKLRNLRSLLTWLKCSMGWQLFALALRLNAAGALTTLRKTRSPATDLRTCLHDMRFNLHPDHPAYHRTDPQAHEAMLCMEALARVPQQVIKWGHRATQHCMPGLYRLYYGQVVPACACALRPETQH